MGVFYLKRGDYILIENQLIKIKWGQRNKKHFIDKGYIFTTLNDEFEVNVADLKPSSKEKVNVICDYCGNEYETQYNLYNKGKASIAKDCCPNCKPLKIREVKLIQSRDKVFNKLESICKEKGYQLITTKEEYTGEKMDIYYICPRHGKQKSLCTNLLRNHGCDCCARENSGIQRRHNIEYIKTEIAKVHNNKLLNPEDYINASTRNLVIECGLCKNTFVTSFAVYKKGKNKCRRCSKKETSGESIIRNFLTKHNIVYEKEKRFLNCKDKRPLPFDFYLNNYNICIEYDGIQHYEPVFSNKSFEMTKKHDQIKNEYCQANNLKLIRIPYYEKDNIYNILSEKILKEIA